MVAADPLRARGDDLRHAIMLHDQRGGPGVIFITILLPDRFPRTRVEHFHVGLSRMVAHNHEVSVMQDR